MDNELKQNIQLVWLFKMAWRDWRASRKKLYLIIASIVLGISAVVAIQSFGTNLVQKIKEDSKSLMGADYIVSARQRPTPKVIQIVDSLGIKHVKLILHLWLFSRQMEEVSL